MSRGSVPGGLLRRSNDMLFEQETSEELSHIVEESGLDAADALIEMLLPPLREGTAEDEEEIYEDDDLEGEGIELSPEEMEEILDGVDDEDDELFESAPILLPGEAPII